MVLPDSFHHAAWTHCRSALDGIFWRRLVMEEPLAPWLPGEDLRWPQQGSASCLGLGCSVGLTEHVTD